MKYIILTISALLGIFFFTGCVYDNEDDLGFPRLELINCRDPDASIRILGPVSIPEVNVLDLKFPDDPAGLNSVSIE